MRNLDDILLEELCNDVELLLLFTARAIEEGNSDALKLSLAAINNLYPK